MQSDPVDPKISKLRQQWRAANARRRAGTQIPMAEYRARVAAEAAARKAAKQAERAAAAALREQERLERESRPRPARTEQQRQQQKAWREANRERMRELVRRWKEANRDKVRKDKRGRNSKSTARRRAALMKVQKGRCGYCRCKLDPGKTHVDHVMPRALGGSNRRSNLQLLCEPCNLSKGAKHPIAFAQSLGRLL